MARLTDRRQTPPPPPPMRAPSGFRPPRRPTDPVLRQRAWAALMLAIISLFGMMMIGNVRRGVYVVAIAAVIAAIALWLSITAMSRARRGGSGRPRAAVLATILGTVGLVFSAFVLVGFAMFWPQLMQYSNCLSGANTVAAQQACQQQLNNSVGSQIGMLGG
jgi:ABC-type amino acid transport system permease subunit